MVKRQIEKLRDIEGLYHKPEWYRTLLYGKHLYMNVTYLLPGVENREIARHRRTLS